MHDKNIKKQPNRMKKLARNFFDALNYDFDFFVFSLFAILKQKVKIAKTQKSLNRNLEKIANRKKYKKVKIAI